MKKTITLAFVIIFAFQINAQISILGGVSTFSADKWDTLMDLPTEGFAASPRSMSPFKMSPMFGASFSIPIPNVGMRILPELNYTSFSSEGWDDISSLDLERINLKLDVQNIALLINTNIYLFNLEGDCDCPTFGKDGGFFKKGFHIQGGPGLVLSVKQTASTEISKDKIMTTDLDMVFAFVIGAGLDIGISDKLTLTPFARYKWIAPQPWMELSNLLTDTLPNDINSNSISNIELGVKLGFRYKN